MLNQKANTVFPTNIAHPLIIAPSSFWYQERCYPSLKFNTFLNKTLNMSLNNIECCFVMLLTQFRLKYCCKHWHHEISKYSTPVK